MGIHNYASSITHSDNSGFLGKISTAPAEILNTRLTKWNNEIESNIRDQKFDCIFSDSEQKIENYKLANKFEKIRSRTIYVWIPANQ